MRSMEESHEVEVPRQTTRLGLSRDDGFETGECVSCTCLLVSSGRNSCQHVLAPAR